MNKKINIAVSSSNDKLEEGTFTEAQELYRQGYEHRKQGDFGKAVEYYTKALDIEPTHLKSLFNRGM